MRPGSNAPEVILERCTGCGQCVSVCPSFVIDLNEEKAGVVRGGWCIGCGHCGAVCPTGAVVYGAPPIDQKPDPGGWSGVSADQLEFLLRERRSVRKYKRNSVPQDILRRILDAGRYAPTGSNSQNVHYVVLTSSGEISRLREMTIGFYEKVFSRVRGRISGFIFSWVAGRKTVEYLRGSLPKIERAYQEMRKGKDPLFYGAPVVVLTHAESWDSCSSFNCSVAIYHCSLLAHTLGLGTCLNGFLVNAVNHDRRIKKWLDIPSDHECYSAMTLGYQNVKYHRFVSRNPPKVIWR